MAITKFTTPYAPIFTYDANVGTTIVQLSSSAGSDPYTIPSPTRLEIAPALLKEAFDQYNLDNPRTGFSFNYKFVDNTQFVQAEYTTTTTDLGSTTLTFTTLEDARKFGFNTLSVNFGPLVIPTKNVFNFAGIFAPLVRVFRMDVTSKSTISSTDGLTYAAPNVVQWGANTSFATFNFQYVQAANVFNDKAETDSFATPAGRNILDEYNTFQKFIEGVRADGEGRCDVYNIGTITANRFDLLSTPSYRLSVYDRLQDLNERLSDVSAGRLYDISIDGRVLLS
jgi:hypothetical protein